MAASRQPEHATPTPLTLVKLGGSLITDKTRPETARPEVIRRLAGELSKGLSRTKGGVILGHGSGSFGHAAASRAGIAEGFTARPEPVLRAGIAETQAAAARLHAQVLTALREAGASPYSIAPSSVLVARRGRPARMALDSLGLALGAGLLPVVYGDVVMDLVRGVAIASTETVFLALARRVPRRGLPISRALWLGETAGVLGPDGRTLKTLGERDLPALERTLRGAAGIDVTGGIRHRVASALALARQGIPSLIFDGREPGALARAVAGEEVPGTTIGARIGR